MNSVENQIHTKLVQGFQPTHLEVVNESYLHSVPAGSETRQYMLAWWKSLNRECMPWHCTPLARKSGSPITKCLIPPNALAEASTIKKRISGCTKNKRL
jgi:hypothetical protein